MLDLTDTPDTVLDLCEGEASFLTAPVNSRFDAYREYEVLWKYPHRMGGYRRGLWAKLRDYMDTGVRWGNVHDMFRAMTLLGGDWVSFDMPACKKTWGWSRPDGTDRQSVLIDMVKEGWHGTRQDFSRNWHEEGPLRLLIETPEGRKEIAHMLTTGDHCLEFKDGELVPAILETMGLTRVL